VIGLGLFSGGPDEIADPVILEESGADSQTLTRRASVALPAIAHLPSNPNSSALIKPPLTHETFNDLHINRAQSWTTPWKRRREQTRPRATIALSL
jgi:hypothetical protein